MALKADDLQEGMLVTVLNYHDIGVRFIDGPDITEYVRNPCTTGLGAPLRIVHVELPYIIVECDGRRGTMDTREMDLMRVSQEYADKLSPPKTEQPQFGVSPLHVFLTDFIRNQSAAKPSEEPKKPE